MPTYVRISVVFLVLLAVTVLFGLGFRLGSKTTKEAPFQSDRARGIVLCVTSRSTPTTHLELRGINSVLSSNVLQLHRRNDLGDGVWCAPLAMNLIDSSQVLLAAAPAADVDTFTMTSWDNSSHPLATLRFQNGETPPFIFVRNSGPVVINVDNTPEAR